MAIEVSIGFVTLLAYGQHIGFVTPLAGGQHIGFDAWLFISVAVGRLLARKLHYNAIAS